MFDITKLHTRNFSSPLSAQLSPPAFPENSLSIRCRQKLLKRWYHLESEEQKSPAAGRFRLSASADLAIEGAEDRPFLSRVLENSTIQTFQLRRGFHVHATAGVESETGKELGTSSRECNAAGGISNRANKGRLTLQNSG
jgi:hypothetical protein